MTPALPLGLRRAAPLAAGALAVLAVLVYQILSEPPRGMVVGQVLLEKTNLPLANATVYLAPFDEPDYSGRDREEREDFRESKQAETDADGRFVIRGVPAGRYRFDCYTGWHQAPEARIDVVEAKASQVTMVMKRSQSALGVDSGSRVVFPIGRTPTLPLRGYGLPGQKLTVAVYRLNYGDALARPDAAEALERMRRSWGEPMTQIPPALKALRPQRVGQSVQELGRKGDWNEAYGSSSDEGYFQRRIALPVPRGKPGLYLAKVTLDRASVCGWALVSDLALVAKRERGGVLAFAAAMGSGQPLAGVRVALRRAGRPADSARTGGDGLARLSGGGTLIATRGDDTTAVRVSEGEDAAGEGYVVHLVTDRPVYRPGHTVQYQAIVRRESGRRYRYAVPAGLPVTVAVEDADGAEVQKETTRTAEDGTFAGQFTISPEAATGTFSVVTKIGKETYRSEVRVASYRKPEMEVSVAPARPRYRRGETVEATVSANYYFGSPVAGGRVRWRAYREGDWTTLYGAESEDDAELGDPQRYYGAFAGSGEAELGPDGKATIRFPVPAVEGAPQLETVTLTASVRDPSGRAVDSEARVQVAAADVVAAIEPDGYVAAPGKASRIFVRVRDAEGRPAAGVPVSLAASCPRWDKEKEANVTVPVGAPQNATTEADGRALLRVTPEKAGELELTATATDAAGRQTVAHEALYAVTDGAQELDTHYGDLELHADRRRYAPGDTARVLLNTAETGQSVLLTVEAETVRMVRLVPIRARSTVVTLPVKAEYGPNVFLVACYVRDGHFSRSATPLRVEIPEKALAVTVTPERSDYRPGDISRWRVRTADASGKPVAARFSLSVVDEAIYAIRRDDPKALWKTFYPRRNETIETRCSLEVEYLDGGDKDGPAVAWRRRFLDTASWQPDLSTGPDGRAEVEAPLPDNLTSWRATVQAVTDKTAVGYGIAHVTVRRPFFVRLETPRFLVEGDRSRLAALVHNETGKPLAATVRLRADGLRLEGDEARTVEVAPGVPAKVEWTFASARAGTATLRLSAWSADRSLTDGVETRLPVSAYGTEETATVAGRARQAPEERSVEVAANAVASQTRLVVRVTPGVGAALAGALEYLKEYPYGCVEQTASRFVPQLRARPYLDAEAAESLAARVRDGVTRLRHLRKSDGGWGWFAQGEEDPFLTAYALEALLVTRAYGFPVPGDVLGEGAKAAAQAFAKAKANERPYLAYVLALADKPIPALKLLRSLTPRSLSGFTSESLAYLTLAGEAVEAEVSLPWGELQRRASREGGLLFWKASDSFDSDRRTTALALRALLRMDPAGARAVPVVRWLLARREDASFGSTLDTAAVVAALCDYLRLHPEEAASGGGALVRVNGIAVAFDQTLPGGERIAHVGSALLHPGANRLEVIPQGGGSVFFAATRRQTLPADPSGEIGPAVTDGVVVAREYLREGEALPRGDFRQDDSIRVRLSLQVPTAREFVVIEDPFPSGFEPTERGTAETELFGDWGFWYDNVDVRDDKIAVFARRLTAGKHVFEYHLRAQTPGRCRALPASVTPMYAAQRRASSRGSALEIAP